jgi:hypothetical protein
MPSKVDDKLHEAIDIDQLVIFQMEVLRDMVLNPKQAGKLNPIDTIDAILTNVKKNGDILQGIRKEFRANENPK